MALSAAAIPNPEQKQALAQLLAKASEFEEAILALLPAGRDRSLAITHLEDSLMRANRAVFQPPVD